MAGVAVVTDSTSCLDPDVAARAGVRVVPLQVVIDDVSRPETEVPPAEVADALRSGRRVTTSRPTPDVFAGVYRELLHQGYGGVVSVHLSGKISGTVAAAELAAASAGIEVRVVDSETLAMAVGFAALAGAEWAAGGATVAEVEQIVRRRAGAGVTYFCVDSLEYLRRGGRIGTAAALLGSALAVKPILTVTGGEIRAHERVRTASKARARLEELGLTALASAAGNSDRVDVAVHHLDNAQGARRLRHRLAPRVGDTTIQISEVSAVLGVHVGPGTLGIVVSPS